MRKNSDDINEKHQKNEKVSIIYLMILLILLIFTFITSFKTGEQIYYLINTDFNDVSANSETKSADWKFEARIEY